MKKHFVFFFSVLTLLVSASVFGENIRGDVVSNIILTDSTGKGENEFVMNIEDVFAVSVERESEFIRGIEISVKVPSSLRNYGSSFAVIIYKQISPAVTPGIGTYYGKKYYSFILPEAARFFIKIPYGSRLENETDPYTTVISELIEYRDSPLMVTILPMMKGFPSSLYSSSFTFSVNPVFRESGMLQLNVDVPEGLNREDLAVRINGKVASAEASEIMLATGDYSLTTEIPGGRNESRNFTINSGETTAVNIEIEKLESYATIEAPGDTIIYLDGEKLNSSPDGRYLIEPGEHTVLFKVSDYKISKKFTVLPGKDCKISLFLDIFIE